MSEVMGAFFKYGLAILGVAAVVLYFYFSMAANKVDNAAADISTLQSNISTLYEGQSNMTSLSNSVVISAKAAPSNMIDGTNLLDPWSGSVTVQPDATAGMFDIIVAGVPQRACTKLATVVSSYKTVTINGSADTAPADPGTVATQCAGSNNQLQFAFSGS